MLDISPCDHIQPGADSGDMMICGLCAHGLVCPQSAAADPCPLIHNVRPAARAAGPLPERRTGVRADLRSNTLVQLFFIRTRAHIDIYTATLTAHFPSPVSLPPHLSSVSGCLYSSHHWGEWNDSQLLPTIQKLMKGYNRYLRPNFNGRNELDNDSLGPEEAALQVFLCIPPN